MNEIEYKICPKCGRMALDYGRGFKYQCLYRDCCWQGDLAKDEIPELTLEERVTQLEKEFGK
jgi:hypothetical protein